MSCDASFSNHPGMEVKDETKRQGNQEMGDQLRLPSLTLQQFQGEAGVQMSLSSGDLALDSVVS